MKTQIRHVHGCYLLCYQTSNSPYTWGLSRLLSTLRFGTYMELSALLSKLRFGIHSGVISLAIEIQIRHIHKVISLLIKTQNRHDTCGYLPSYQTSDSTNIGLSPLLSKLRFGIHNYGYLSCYIKTQIRHT